MSYEKLSKLDRNHVQMRHHREVFDQFSRELAFEEALASLHSILFKTTAGGLLSS
jgi:hypothetical protein